MVKFVVTKNYRMSKILVIDDERSIRNTLKDILEYEKYEVELAEDGNVGLTK